MGTNINVPTNVAVCPICGASLTVDLDGYSWNPDGSLTVDGGDVHSNCSTEPYIDDEDWDDWFNGHYSMPYADWLPIETILIGWINGNKDFAKEHGVVRLSGLESNR